MSTPANFNGPQAAAVSPALQETLAPPQEKPPHKEELSTTSLLIICNTLIFCAMLAHWIYITGWKEVGNTLLFAKFDSELLRSWGSDFGPLTLTGQFWRVLTARFLHFNFPHLAFNMLFLWGLGRPLGRLLTRAQMLGIYLLTGAAGSVWSLYWHPLRYSVGASGAIYGLAGVWIALLVFGRLGLPRRTVIGILMWLFFLTPIELLRGKTFEDTNYAAHAGGAVSGFVIGIFFALIFRLPEAKYAVLQRAFLRFAAVALILLFAVVTQARKDTVSRYLNAENIPWTSHHSYSPHQPRIARVFLDFKGDPKLVRYFSGILNAELENAGVAVAGSEHDADGVVRAELKARIEHVDLSMGVVKMYINSQRGPQTIDSCRTLSTGDNNLYERSAANAVSEIRDRYHDARTVRLDSASNLAASPQFAAEFPSELKTSGLTMVQAGPADIVLRVDLQTQKTPVEENAAVYDIKAVTSDGAPLFERSGSGVLAARLVGDAPAACPEQLADLEWIYNSNTLPSIAHKVASDLYDPQAAPRATKPASKPK